SGAGGFGYVAIQRRDGRGVADASSKLAVEIAGQIAGQIKSGEDASWLRQPGRKRRRGRKRLTLQAGKNRLMRDLEQGPALLERKFLGSKGGRLFGQIFGRFFRQLGHRFFSAGRGRRPGAGAFPICGRSATRKQQSSRARKPAKAEP